MKKSIELQLVKPIKGSMKGRITIENLVKEVLDNVNVAYADLCCPEGDQIPNGAPVRFNNNDLEYFDVTTNTWVDATPAIAASRFGVAGEDDTQAEHRLFVLQAGASFEIYNAGLTNGMALYGGGTQFDVYSQADVGDAYANFDLYQGGWWLDAYDDGTGNEVYIEADGNLLYWEFIDGGGGGPVWHIEGITQDDASEQILALDVNGDVRFVDKATIGVAPGQSSVFAAYDVILLPDDATPVTGFNVPIETGKRYSFEAYFQLIIASGVDYTVNIDLPGSAGLSTFTYEFAAPASGGEVDTTGVYRNRTNGESAITIPSASFNAPTGSPYLKITGYIDTNDVAGDVTVTANVGAGPQTGSLSGWIKLTELTDQSV